MNTLDRTAQPRKVVRNHGPDDEIRDLVVLVPQHIADPAYLFPRNFLFSRQQVGRKMAGCFRDDLYPALYTVAQEPIRLELLELLTGRGRFNAV